VFEEDGEKLLKSVMYVAAIVFMCYVLELHSLCCNTQPYMCPVASLLVGA